MISTTRSFGFSYASKQSTIPFLRFLLLGSLVCTLLGSPARAGFLVGNNPGSMGGNDKVADVISEIGEYNAANDPDLTATISLFKKSDDDAADLFNLTNDNHGFSFFEADTTTPITIESELTNSEIAYFSYLGPENILFYSVKAGSSGFSLYTFMAGLNLLELGSATKEISHVSFWTGPPGINFFGDPIPEPASLALALVGLCGILAQPCRV